MYSEKVIQYMEHPVNIGSLDKDAPNVGTGMVGSPICGDIITFQIMLGDDGKISDARFKSFGCAANIASSCMATEMLKGRTLDEALQIKNKHIARELGLPPEKVHCSVLCEDGIQKAVEDLQSKLAKED